MAEMRASGSPEKIGLRSESGPKLASGWSHTGRAVPPPSIEQRKIARQSRLPRLARKEEGPWDNPVRIQWKKARPRTRPRELMDLFPKTQFPDFGKRFPRPKEERRKRRIIEYGHYHPRPFLTTRRPEKPKPSNLVDREL